MAKLEETMERIRVEEPVKNTFGQPDPDAQRQARPRRPLRPLRELQSMWRCGGARHTAT
jgi:hypothetical protein